MGAGVVDQVHVVHARRTGGHAGEAGEAAVDMGDCARSRRAVVLQHVLDQVDAARAGCRVRRRAAGRSGRSRCRSRNARRCAGSRSARPCRGSSSCSGVKKVCISHPHEPGIQNAPGIELMLQCTCYRGDRCRLRLKNFNCATDVRRGAHQGRVAADRCQRAAHRARSSVLRGGFKLQPDKPAAPVENPAMGQRRRPRARPQTRARRSVSGRPATPAGRFRQRARHRGYRPRAQRWPHRRPAPTRRNRPLEAPRPGDRSCPEDLRCAPAWCRRRSRDGPRRRHRKASRARARARTRASSGPSPRTISVASFRAPAAP